MTATPAQTPPAIPSVLNDVPLAVTIRIGTVRKTVYELLRFTEGLEIVLETKADDPIELCIEDRVVAYGELVEGEGGALAIRVTELVAPENA